MLIWSDRNKFGYLIYILILLPIFPYDFPTTTRLENGEAITLPPTPVIKFISLIASELIILFFISVITCTICICIYLITQNRYKAVGMPIIAYYLLYEVSLHYYRQSSLSWYISPYFIINYAPKTIFLYLGLTILILCLYMVYAKLLDRRLSR